MVVATYIRCNKFFIQNEKKVTTMIKVGNVYFKVTSKTLED